MSDLTSGRTEPCKDGLGGIRTLYLMDYVRYTDALLVGYKSMTLTSFPTTLIFEYQGNQQEVIERYNEDAFEQEVKFRMSKQDLSTNRLVNLLSNKLVRVIAEDYKGGFMIYGLKNGMDVDVSLPSGSGKSDFNGYEVTIKGKEEYSAHFVSDLATVGFVTEGVTFGELLASSSRPTSLNDSISSTSILQ